MVNTHAWDGFTVEAVKIDEHELNYRYQICDRNNTQTIKCGRRCRASIGRSLNQIEKRNQSLKCVTSCVENGQGIVTNNLRVLREKETCTAVARILVLTGLTNTCVDIERNASMAKIPIENKSA